MARSRKASCVSCGKPVDTTIVHYVDDDGVRHVDCPPPDAEE